MQLGILANGKIRVLLLDDTTPCSPRLGSTTLRIIQVANSATLVITDVIAHPKRQSPLHVFLVLSFLAHKLSSSQRLHQGLAAGHDRAANFINGQSHLAQLIVLADRVSIEHFDVQLSRFLAQQVRRPGELERLLVRPRRIQVVVPHRSAVDLIKAPVHNAVVYTSGLLKTLFVSSIHQSSKPAYAYA